MDRFRQDLRYAIRTLLKSPLFAVTVVLTLGVGIGANTAIFSFVDTMLLRPLPYPEPDDIVVVWQDFGSTGGPQQEWFTPPDYADLASQPTTLAAVSTIAGWNPNLTGVEQAKRLTGLAVSPGYFTIAGVAPAMGRSFTAGEVAAGATDVVVISDDLWRTTFGADPSIIGSSVQLMGSQYTVVGVMPRGFEPPFQPADVWRPYSEAFFGAGCTGSRGCYVTQVLARVRPEVTLEQARSEMAVFSRGLREADPGEKAGVEIRLVRLHDQIAGPVEPMLVALLASVGLLLLIACVNVANLLIARAAGREREVAVRAAIGASRGRLIRQLMTESVIVGLAGGAAGLLIAYWGVDVLVAMSPPGAPRLSAVGVDPRALGFASALSLCVGLVFGLVPALHLSRVKLSLSLKESGGARGGRSRTRMRNVLVAAEVAIALMLLAGAGLMVRNLVGLNAVDPGFEPRRAAAVQLLLPQAGYAGTEQVNAFIDGLVDRLEGHPSVSAAGAVSILPMTGTTSDTGFRIEGRPLTDGRGSPATDYRSATPGYLEAAGLRLLRGRWLTAADRAGAPEVVVINESFAERFYPNEDPIGRRISYRGEDGPWSTIVGTIADVYHRGLDQPTRPEMYMSHLQLPARSMYVVMRTSAADASALIAQVRSEVNALDPDLPLAGQTTLEDLVGQSIAIPKLFVAFFGFFAFVALLLAAVGIYGVTAQAVGQRAQEIGIRMALGADARGVVMRIVGQAMLVALTGLAIGLAAALALAGRMRGLLFELSPTDPATFATIATILAVVALIAAWVPARRAASVEPMKALRTE
jgi:putative ABC transport system permease protein